MRTVGLLLKGCRQCRRQSLLSREDFSTQLCIRCPFYSTHQDMKQYAQFSNIRAHAASPPGYKTWPCARLLRLMETLPEDVLNGNNTQGSCSSGQCSNRRTATNRGQHGAFGCYPDPFNTFTLFEPASIDNSNTSSKTSSKIQIFGGTLSVKDSLSFINSLAQSRRFCLGLWSQKRRDQLCIGRRSVFSARNYGILRDLGFETNKDVAFSVPASDEKVVDIPESDEEFDFRNFPALTSSFYQDYERPSAMQVKKRVTWKTSRKLSDTDSKLTVESIPQPKGRMYDFGLGDWISKPPPLEAGARPQGGFDINISLDECEGAPSETPSSFLIGFQRPSTGNLPRDTPETDSLSETK